MSELDRCYICLSENKREFKCYRCEYEIKLCGDCSENQSWIYTISNRILCSINCMYDQFIDNIGMEIRYIFLVDIIYLPQKEILKDYFIQCRTKLITLYLLKDLTNIIIEYLHDSEIDYNFCLLLNYG